MSFSNQLEEQLEEDTPTIHVNNPHMDGTSLFNGGKIKDIERKNSTGSRK